MYFSRTPQKASTKMTSCTTPPARTTPHHRSLTDRLPLANAAQRPPESMQTAVSRTRPTILLFLDVSMPLHGLTLLPKPRKLRLLLANLPKSRTTTRQKSNGFHGAVESVPALKRCMSRSAKASGGPHRNPDSALHPRLRQRPLRHTAIHAV